MEDSIFIPVIIGAVLSPNPATVGKPVFISIAATDLEAVPQVEVYYSNEFYSGEV